MGLLTGGSRTSPAAKFPFRQFMAPVAKASLLSNLESQREQELAEALAIQVGMLPHGSVRTVDTTTCHEFQPFYEVGGDFLDFSR